jgi:hypothetical protein
MAINKFDNEGEYTFRLLPNIHDPKTSVKIIRVMVNDNRPYPDIIKIHLKYILLDGKVMVSSIPRYITTNIEKMVIDDISLNTEGLYLGGGEVDNYIYDKESGTIQTNVEDLPDIKTDVYLYKQFLPTSFHKGYSFSFKVADDRGYKKFYDLTVNFDVEPLYKEGDDKNKILEMWKDVPKLEDAEAEYISELKTKNPSLLINEEIDTYFSLKKKINSSVDSLFDN